jgi:uncharacterized protein (TIGR00251 family)
MSDSVLKVTVVPRSSATKIVGFKGDALKVKVTSAPVDGSANRDVIDVLSKRLKVSKRRIEIIAGHTSRTKVIRFRDISSDELSRYLGP